MNPDPYMYIRDVPYELFDDIVQTLFRYQKNDNDSYIIMPISTVNINWPDIVDIPINLCVTVCD